MSYKNILLFFCQLVLIMTIGTGHPLPNWMFYVLTPLFVAFLGLTSVKGLKALLGVLVSVWPLILYYLYLMISIKWSLYPAQSTYFVFGHGIFISASVLCALLIRNLELKKIIEFFQLAAYVALVLTIIDFFTYSGLGDMTRLGSGGSTATLYVALPFMLLADSKNSIKKFTPIFIALLLLSVSASRTPLLCGGLGILLTILWTEKNVALKVKRILQLVFIGIFMLMIIIAIPPFRLFMLRLFVRITGIDLSFYNSFLEADGEDITRVALWEESIFVYKEFWLEGMGYMSFQSWFGEMYNYEYEDEFGNQLFGVNLHNSFMT